MADVDGQPGQRTWTLSRHLVENKRASPADKSISVEPPNLHLSPEERRYFGQLFSSADTDKLGVVTGETAVKFFEKTRLASDVLGEIWQIADTENRGLLTPVGFGVVLRLIGYAQAGRPVSAELALKRKSSGEVSKQ